MKLSTTKDSTLSHPPSEIHTLPTGSATLSSTDIRTLDVLRLRRWQRLTGCVRSKRLLWRSSTDGGLEVIRMTLNMTALKRILVIDDEPRY